MKLKDMYTCVTRRPDSDGAYEPSDKKVYQNKKLYKPSKRNGFSKPKWQSLTKNPKTPPKTPPKSPGLITTPPPPKTPPPPIPVEQPPPTPKRNSPRTKKPISNKTTRTSPAELIRDNRSLPEVPSTVPTTLGIDRTVDRKNSSWSPAFHNHSGSFESENAALIKSSPRYSPVGPDEFNSHDDVFSRSSPSWPNPDENDWDQRFQVNIEDTEDETIKLLRTLKFSSFQAQGHAEITNQPLLEQNKHNLLDLKNKMFDKYELVADNLDAAFPTQNGMGTRTDSLSSLSSSSSLVTTSVDRATATFESVRAICDEQRAVRMHSCEYRKRAETGANHQRNNCTANVVPLPRRAFSTSVATKDVNWSEIPPLIPPREPVRSTRSSPPHRHTSTPSPRSSLRRSPSASNYTTKLSSSAHFESSRQRTHPSTTAVFSALPPRITGSSPIILPIMKDGQQESSTHYYLLEDDTSIPKSQRPPQPKPEPLNGIARPTPSGMLASFTRSNDPAPPRPPPPSSSLTTSSPGYLTPPANAIMSAHPASTYPPRRIIPSLGDAFETSLSNLSPSSLRYREMGPGQKVVALQAEVFGVTDEECQSALKINSWNVGKSIKYLKTEQLFRVGLSSRENCQQILQACKWDLQSSSRVLLEQHQSS